MAVGFWNFKAPKSHDEELEMRQAAAEAFRQSNAIERARQLLKEQEEREHEAWKRQLLRDRNVTVHASTSPPRSDLSDNVGQTMLNTMLVYSIASGGGSGYSSSCDTSSSSDSSSSSSFDSSSSSSSDSSSSSGGTE